MRLIFIPELKILSKFYYDFVMIQRLCSAIPNKIMIIAKYLNLKLHNYYISSVKLQERISFEVAFEGIICW